MSNQSKYSATSIIGVVLFVFFSYLHYVAEINIRQDTPAHSDSLAYQNAALHDFSSLQRGDLSLKQFALGDLSLNHVPPLHKWSLQFGYLFFGINNHTPYFVSALWMLLLASGLFVLVQRHTGDNIFATIAALLSIGLPASLLHGFAETRNDWPVAALCIMSFHLFCSSNFFKDRRRTLLGALFAGLALLVKSSLAGYLIFPAIFLVLFVYRKKHTLGDEGLKNILFGFGVILLVSGWFYYLKLEDIFAWYSFWGEEKIADVKAQYQLVTTMDERVFYLKNLYNQFGNVQLALILPGWLALLFKAFWKDKKFVAQETGFALAWAAVFAFTPYLILIARSSYSSLADINMLPFQIFLGVMGLYYLSKLFSIRRYLSLGLLALVLYLNVCSVITHYQGVRYHGVDASKATDKLVALLEGTGADKFRIWSIYHDIYFNPSTVMNLIYRNQVMRSRFDLALPDLDLQTMHSPNMTPEKRYKNITDKADLLLGTSSHKGFDWVTLNREWGVLKQLLAADSRFVLLGNLSPYKDGTKVNVYAKETASVGTSSDHWLMNGMMLSVLAQQGERNVRIEGDRHGVSVTDMRLVTGENVVFYGKPCESVSGKGCFSFTLTLTTFPVKFKVESDTPLIPSKLGSSSDSRQLLFYKPKVFIY